MKVEIKSPEAELVWRDLTLTATASDSTKKMLLRNISGSVGPSSLTALMGSSGAGKTTLLNSLAGRISQSLALRGEILLNSRHRRRDTWPELVGYVEQEFHAYEYQTVFETLLFASQIKLGKDMSSHKTIDNINDILATLGLKGAKNTYMSKLSCGERKRVSIGVELLGDPPILFCDEPTSGLDSFNALNILSLLKKLSQMGKTILVTIHQPSYEMMMFFDKMILMSQGHIIYDGSVSGCIRFFDSCGFKLPELTNPADFFLNTISVDTRTAVGEASSHRKIEQIRRLWERESVRPSCKVVGEMGGVSSGRGTSASFLLLFVRNISNYVRNVEYLKIKVFQKAFFIFVFGLAYLQIGYSIESIYTRLGGITFIITNILFGVSSPILNTFPSEKKIIFRERRSGMYSGFVGFVAKYCSEVVIDMVFEVLYVTAVYWMIGLKADARAFGTFLVIACSVSLFSLAYGLTISATTTSANASQILGSIVSLVLFIYSGSLNNPNDIPVWLRWLIWISPVYYATKAGFQNQLMGQTFSDGKGRVVTGEEVLASRGLEGTGVWPCTFILWGITAVWIVVGSVVLHYTTRNNIKMESNKEDV